MGSRKRNRRRGKRALRAACMICPDSYLGRGLNLIIMDHHHACGSIQSSTKVRSTIVSSLSTLAHSE
jgi:hypothetical protein